MRTGLLPDGTLGRHLVTLADNEAGHFVCRWIDLKIGDSVCRFADPAEFDPERLSELDIAGICDPSGLILGMMPNPATPFTHIGFGLPPARGAVTTLFKNIVSIRR